MANPYVFGAAAFPYEDLPFQSQSYSPLEDGFGDSTMTFLDPTLQSPSPVPYGNTWAAPVQRPIKENLATYFAANVPNHTPIRPSVGIPSVLPSYARFASPISSIEPPSSGGALSPLADTESYHDGYPRTPPDSALLSPFQPPLPLEPFAHAVQFRSMGPDYVNPFDVNPSQQSEYCESDNGIIDFNFATQPAYFDSHASHDSTAVLDSTAGQPALMQPAAKGEIEASSQYPPPPNEDMGSDDEAPVKRQNDDDGDYQPNKRQKTNARTPARRGAKTTTTASPSRRTRNRAPNPAPPRTLPSSSNASKPRLSCPDCKQRGFPSQPDLDAHIKKEHRRPFNCVFDFAGCVSTFASKNEWKRHVATQHLLLHYWVCTEGVCAKAHSQPPPPTGSLATAAAAAAEEEENPHGAIFNRKDLFTQHLKRMHAPQEIKDLPKRATPKSTTTTTNPQTTALLAQWNARLKKLQDDAVRPRCHLPHFMRCPVPGCAAQPFRGQEAWNQRMEHVAKHMGKAAGPGAGGRVVFGGAGDATLVEWAASAEVAIIVPAEAGGWVLKSPLKRGPGGNVVVTAPVGQGQAGGEDGVVEGEIVVVSQGCDEDGDEEEEEEEDAEGEEDD
ncbi:hypothetical protein C8A01DRAFT_49991 [Parachaetomium inaequale]|uniref:C2H2-type domain-containing protein n=1 Tax=Parachaetomium inaequale TaxID=2588326 RepID=A0AAN6PBP7_9PEZI|nr:hypothetical protein C8A01DRAFT_49991 [Parachaetomium inaequale]